MGLNPFNIRTLINQLTGVPLSYLLIRLIRHPRYLPRNFISQIRSQIDAADAR